MQNFTFGKRAVFEIHIIEVSNLMAKWRYNLGLMVFMAHAVFPVDDNSDTSILQVTIRK